MDRGYFGICMFEPKNEKNWGSLIRTANLLNASFIATIGERFFAQESDTMKTWKHIPQFKFKTFDDFLNHIPKCCRLVGIELDDSAVELKDYKHHERAVYLLGAEDYGLPDDIIKRCHDIVKLRGKHSMNVSVAGSIVLYHREAMQ